MPESDLHRFYIKKIICHIEDIYCINDSKLIVSDLSNMNVRPPKIDRYFPDVYYQSLEKRVEIVGEAKSCGDITTTRSVEQIKAFIKYCNSKNAIFIVAVPWDEYATAVGLIKNICRKFDIIISFKVIELLPRNCI